MILLRLPYLTLVLVIVFSLKAFSGEEDLYDFLWLDPDKSVYVLQNKLYPKKGRVYFDLGYVSNTSSNFQDTTGGLVKLGYSFSEEFALEFNHITYSNMDNSAVNSVESVAGLVPFIRRPLSSNSLFLVWTPFYGKINTFNKIYYFDWGFGVGSGSLKMESNLDTAEIADKDIYKAENYTPLQFKTHFKFHINKRFHLGIEYLNTNYQAPTPKDKNSKSWTQNNDLIFTLGASF